MSNPSLRNILFHVELAGGRDKGVFTFLLGIKLKVHVTMLRGLPLIPTYQFIYPLIHLSLYIHICIYIYIYIYIYNV